MPQKLIQKGRTPMVLHIRLRRTWLLALYLVSISVCSSTVTADDLPPIECPLRKAGIDKTKLKPFEEVEDYIKFLERADRAKWQKPEAVVKTLGLKGTESVVDLGSGSGYFTFRLSKAVPKGKVIAIDSQPEMVRHVHRKVLTGEWPKDDQEKANRYRDTDFQECHEHLLGWMTSTLCILTGDKRVRISRCLESRRIRASPTPRLLR